MAQPFMNPNYFNPYQQQVQPPMDRLAQLQAQQYQGMAGTQMSLPQQPNQSLLYVQGEAAAKSWMVGAGQSVLLMDSENPVFYIKSADASGIPLPLRVFDYAERTQNMPQNAPQATQTTQTNLDDKYVTREEYNAMQGKYAEILDRLDSFHSSAMDTGNAGKPAAAANKSRGKGGDSNE